MAFAAADLDDHDFIEFDPCYLRPAEVDLLIGDPEKAKRQLGWEPKVKLPELVRMMVEGDLELAEQENVLREAGHTRVGALSTRAASSTPTWRWVCT